MNEDGMNRVAPPKGRFYVLSPDMGAPGRGHGVELDNEEEIPWPTYMSEPSEVGGLASLRVVPKLRFDSQVGDMPLDLQGGFNGYWLISQPLKDVMENIDAEGFAFAKCAFQLEDGSEGEPHYLCEVIRILDAIDENASSVKILDGYRNGKYYSLSGGGKLSFKEAEVADAHVFMDIHSGSRVYCDRVLRDALIEHGFGMVINPRGVWIEDAAGY
ncbi:MULTISPECIES: imm11 family protein [Stenotrophomonas maltophilia group]|nr:MULTISPECIES: DUF1629 domain-containing protein [Stenotrophomonas maltophilia group]MCZ7842224.1 DUF1629 domain-containing protein [Stenotrophomonas maltophilia]MDJ1626264.1 DUF1629 domain-containing protein [Stenotrophomonas sepilia]